MVNVKELEKFEVFLRLLAGRVGQLVNLSALSGDVGVSSTTLAGWLSVLEVDLIREYQRRPYAIEVKAGTTYVSDMLRSLKRQYWVIQPLPLTETLQSCSFRRCFTGMYPDPLGHDVDRGMTLV